VAKKRIPFALNTFRRVKQKVFDMLCAPGERFELDWNELLIVRTCLQLYTIDLLCMKQTPERSQLVERCYEVASLLPPGLPAPLQLHD